MKQGHGITLVYVALDGDLWDGLGVGLQICSGVLDEGALLALYSAQPSIHVWGIESKAFL